MKLKAQLHEYAQWRDDIAQAIESYLNWRERYDLADTQSKEALNNVLNALNSERIILGFAAENSRDKIELINALFFAETEQGLLPLPIDHMATCATELFYDGSANYIRLLDIETRLEDISLIEYRKNPEAWIQIELDPDSPAQMQEAIKKSLAVKQVSKEHAYKLGLLNGYDAHEADFHDQDQVEIPCWRYALISLSNPLLKQGLCILDTPGLQALQVEPELTLSVLPSAELIVYVFAADTGLSENDQAIWHSYINKVRDTDQRGLAVMMHKAEALLDGLLNETEKELALNSQINKSARILGVNEQRVFPFSASPDLLENKALKRIGSYLTKNVLLRRRAAMQRTVANGIGFLLSESLRQSEAKYKRMLDQLAEFNKIDCDNATMMETLLTETRDRQQAYLLNVANFQASRRVFGVQAKALVSSLALGKFDAIVQRSKDDLTSSFTTYGMKKNIQILFDDLRDLLQQAANNVDETRKLVKKIHKQFGVECGFECVEPKFFSIKHFQDHLEQILDEGEDFRSSTKTTLTEQAVVFQKLYNLIIARARLVFKEAHQEAVKWSKTVLWPLTNEIKEHKKQVDSRLYMLHKMSSSKESVAENISHLEEKLVPLIQQFTELQSIISEMNIEGKADH
ncbi:dynamin family protein [Methyloprofundus sp.]|uniref:dynamin family protein n=1 Tax=Methyloprofundus sp. TaxID=2020875 RepID=UPI003D0B0910